MSRPLALTFPVLLIAASVLGGCSLGRDVGSLSADGEDVANGAKPATPAPSLQHLADNARAARAKGIASDKVANGRSSGPSLIRAEAAVKVGGASGRDPLQAARDMIANGRGPKRAESPEGPAPAARRMEEPAISRLPNEAIPPELMTSRRVADPPDERPVLASAATPPVNNAAVLQAIDRLRLRQAGGSPALAEDVETTASIPRKPAAPSTASVLVQFAIGETTLGEAGRRTMDGFVGRLPYVVRSVELVGGLAGEGDAFTRLSRANARAQAVARRLPPDVAVETRFDAALSNDSVRVMPGVAR